MSHPSVVTLGPDRAPRQLVCGEELREVNLPAGTRVIYPRVPLPGSDDPGRDIRQALDEPLGCEPFSSRLRPGMRLAVALEALYHGPDARYEYMGLALAAVVEVARNKGVRQVDVVLATGIHRRLFPAERRALLREVNMNDINVHVHDPEGEGELVELVRDVRLGASPLSLNRVAAQSDLLVTVAISGAPFGGGHTPLVLGLGGYENARALCTRETSSDHRIATSELGVAIEQHLAVFALELVLDSTLQHHELGSLDRNEDDLSTVEQLSLRGVNRLPRRIRIELLERARKHPRLIGVYCGDTSKVSEAAARRYVQQHAVPFTTPADVVVTGLPLNTPLNSIGYSRSGVALNPVLIKHTLEALILQRNTGVPLLKPGGSIVLLHPCSLRFDHGQHTAFFDFFNTLLTEHNKRPPPQKESDFLHNPALLGVFRNGHACHPALPFLLWQQAEAASRAREQTSAQRVFVVGADNQSVPQLLGYETASSVAEALFRARNGSPRAQDVVCLHNPLAVLCHQVEH